MRIPLAELICYFLLPTIGLTVLGVLDPSFWSRAVERAPQGLFFLIFFANRWAMLQAYAVTLYLPFRLLQLVKGGGARLASGELITPRAFLSSVCIVVVGNGYAMLANTLIFFDVCRQSPERVFAAGRTLMEWDYTLFGTYPPFALQGLVPEWLGRLRIATYSNLAYATSLMLIVLLVTRTELFRRYTCSAILAFFFALPCWLSVPGLSLEEMYRREILGPARMELAEREVVDDAVYAPSLLRFLDRIEKLWSKPAEGHLAVSSWPSMHVVWAFLIMWFGVKLRRGLGVIVIPFFLLNVLATLYTLQHYVVDLLISVPVTAAALLLTEWLIRFRKDEELGVGFALPRLAQSDARAVIALARRGYR